MACEVEGTDEFQDWFDGLSDAERRDVVAAIDYLELKGTTLGFPQSSDVHSSRHKQMRELRIQHKGRPYRVLYAFDPRRIAILLLGGDKTGDDRWYEKNVPIADDRYDEYLEELRREGLI